MTATETAPRRVIGTPMVRKEDPKLLTGEAKFTDDLVIPGALHLALVRSPYAHARIGSIDLTAARSMPGVVAVYAGADLQDLWAAPMPCAWPVTADMKNPPHFPVATDKARYVGDAVAVVVARSNAEARDAADAVHPDYEPLEAVIDLEDAASDRVLVHDELGTNTSYVWSLDIDPDGAVQKAFDTAAYSVKERYVQQRLIPMAMEPRAVAAVPQPVGGEITLYSATQIPHGSRSLAVGGVAIDKALDQVIDKARAIAAHQLEAAEEDLVFADGTFSVSGSPETALPLAAIAFAAFTAHNLPDDMEPNLEATVTYDPPNFSWPFGTHMCVVEVDTETGAVQVLKYVAVDDCGVQINPLIVNGQVHGGVVQGLAQALFEEAVYDEHGNLRTATLADYLVPAASDVPAITTDHTVTPSPTNSLGVKGIGEAGTIGAAPAVINAIVDALSHLGVRDIPMPASPQRVWEAIQAAGGNP